MIQVFLLAEHAHERSVLLSVLFGSRHGCVEFRFDLEELVELHVHREQ